MNYEGMGVDILEIFASFQRIETTYFGIGFCVRDPAKQQEQTRAWKAEHPARARELNMLSRRRQGITAQRGAPRKPFVDQHGVLYASCADAAARCGLARSTPSKILRGKIRSAKGYIFTYVKKEEPSE